jgi:hypothetical protein
MEMSTITSFARETNDSSFFAAIASQLECGADQHTALFIRLYTGPLQIVLRSIEGRSGGFLTEMAVFF